MPENRFQSDCLEIFDTIEEKRKEIFQSLDSLSDKQLRFKPGPDDWNLLQVLHHIYTSEKLSYLYIKRKITGTERPGKTGWGSSLRLFALKAAFLLPVKYKAPSIVDASDEDPDYDSMKTNWKDIRSGLRELIEESETEILEREIYKHPAAGLMNMKQALLFMKTHMSHHEKQMERIMNHPSFPE